MAESSLPSHVLNRASGFGFMASAEIRAAGVGNLGLQDRESTDPTACGVCISPEIYRAIRA
jgi:hypothetical protein